jgi:hypothetical protein
MTYTLFVIIAIMLLMAITTTTTASFCPSSCHSDFIGDHHCDLSCYYPGCENYDGGDCYFIIVKKKLSWYDAQSYCRHHYNSNLATVDTRSKLNILYLLWKRKLHFSSLWIGLQWDGHDSEYNKQDWSWVSGDSYDWQSQDFWRGMEPNHFPDQEDCVFFWKGGKQKAWDNAPCHSRQYFACDYPPSVAAIGR